MWETKWNDIKETNNQILGKILEYNSNISKGNYLECPCELDQNVYYDILAAHIINLFLEEPTLYISSDIVMALNLQNSKIMNLVEWNNISGNFSIKNNIDINKDELIETLIKFCFNEKAQNFIQEICAQDINYFDKLAKDIGSLLGTIQRAIELEVKGEEEIFRQLSELRLGGKKKLTKVQERYCLEYTNRGALIRNRIFKHNFNGKRICDKVDLSKESDNLLDYRIVKNFCQSAILHIGIEETGSSGTGFIISEDGYALTCAHVVEGAKEIYATVINGDGYATEGFKEGFEVYDAGNGKVVYTNELLDIALLKMEHYGSGVLPIEKRTILPELGEEVVVFGYPLGYEMPQSNFFGPNISFYKGYVSSNQIKDGNSVTFLDIDVKSGNSGSPVISTKTGKVIGIMSGVKVGGKIGLNEKMPYMIPIQHFLELNK